jgi:hypothetical protein
MSGAILLPSKRTRSTNSMLRACAELHARRDGADREHASAGVTSCPSAFRAVPAWKTKTPSSAAAG